MMIMTSYSEWGAKSAESRGECSERPPVSQKGRQNYTLLEQRGMVFDIFINCWWKYQIYNNIYLI